MFTRRFWRSAAERAVKTAAQFVLYVIGVGAVAEAAGPSPTAETVNALAWDPVALASSGLAGAVISVLFSLASTRVGDASSPSVVNES